MNTKLRYFLSWVSWPGLVCICTAITAVGFSYDHPIIGFNIAYLFLIVSLLWLEREMPHEVEWKRKDGQFWQDIGHTLSSKGTVQLLLLFSTVIGLAEWMPPLSEKGYGIWPRELPLVAQVVLALVVVEFPLYWAHRIGHEWMPMWRFHSVHHSVRKLYIVNTGRFHFVDSLESIVMGMGVLILCGAPLEMVKWTSAITAFIGMLTHCNVEMRFGFLSVIFNTPELHRWHHSKKLKEGNSNYGENLMLWDQIFGSYLRPDRRPPVNVGITTYMPPGFVDQLIWPFLTKSAKARVEAKYGGRGMVLFNDDPVEDIKEVVGPKEAAPLPEPAEKAA